MSAQRTRTRKTASRRRRPARRPAARRRGRRSSGAGMRWAWAVVSLFAAGVVIAIVWAFVALTQMPRMPGGLAERDAPAVAAPQQGVGVDPAPESGVRADPAWTARVAEATGIPARALSAYATAALVVAGEDPACGIGWNTLAGIGAIESQHGSHGGAVLRDDGYPDPAIRGIALDGTESAEIRDTDGGRWDGDTVWDRAVGPMQFIPDTWERWGDDASGDGVADPNQIDDAALAAGRYLCASGEMTSVDGWRRAIFSYNNLDTYVDDVAATANAYATRAAS